MGHHHGRPSTHLGTGVGLGSRAGRLPVHWSSTLYDDAEQWFLWIDEFTPERRNVPFETTNLAGGQWTPSKDFRLPKDPCHGVVLPVTAEEYERLSRARPCC